jgi:hypothetical protein
MIHIARHSITGQLSFYNISTWIVLILLLPFSSISRWFEFHRPGEFVMYENSDLNTRVERSFLLDILDQLRNENSIQIK